VNPKSVTETYVALRIKIDNWRWAGVPFLLRSGKRLAKRVPEIAVTFKHPPMHLFRPFDEVSDDLSAARAKSNLLVLRIQPDEGISLSFACKRPGIKIQLDDVHMDFFYGREGYGGTYPMPYPLLVQGSIHHFDFLRWALDAEPRWVWATNFNPPWVTGPGMRSGYVAFEMENGVQACYRAVPTRADHTSWLTEWRIEGTEGLAEVRRDRVSLNGEEILSGWEDGEAFNNRRLPELQGIVLGEFLAYLGGGPEPGISGRNNLRSLEMTHAAIHASETGVRQALGVFAGVG